MPSNAATRIPAMQRSSGQPTSRTTAHKRRSSSSPAPGCQLPTITPQDVVTVGGGTALARTFSKIANTANKKIAIHRLPLAAPHSPTNEAVGLLACWLAVACLSRQRRCCVAAAGAYNGSSNAITAEYQSCVMSQPSVPSSTPGAQATVDHEYRRRSLVPHLVVVGGRAAIVFYQHALGAQVVVPPVPWPGNSHRIMHAVLKVRQSGFPLRREMR
jgi:hypothetical protein